MAKARFMCTSEAEYAKALEYERRAMRALVGRLLEAHLPYETVSRLCYEAMLQLAAQRSPAYRPGIEFLVGEALESMHLLIDEMVQRPER